MKEGFTEGSLTIAYYVSGHGFGHARRTAQVLSSLAISRPDVRVIVRTAAPEFLFAGIRNVTVSTPGEMIDPGVVEKDTLTIDAAASVERLAVFLKGRAVVVEREADFLRGCGARLVVADIVFLAAEAAEAAGIASIAVGNFTWDWIFEPFVDGARAGLIEEIRSAHGKFEALLHLPLGHEVRGFRQVIEVPLLAPKGRVDRSDALRRLGMNEADGRRRILVALRGGLAEDALVRAAEESPDLVFIAGQAIAGGPENLHGIDGRAGLDFSDILGACDAVISKLGYGILSDCIANGTALLFPPRVGFREDEISRRICPDYIRMREISAERFGRGEWGLELKELLGQANAPRKMAFDGDEVIARLILKRIDKV